MGRRIGSGTILVFDSTKASTVTTIYDVDPEAIGSEWGIATIAALGVGYLAVRAGLLTEKNVDRLIPWISGVVAAAIAAVLADNLITGVIGFFICWFISYLFIGAGLKGAVNGAKRRSGGR
jgi:hypothetical protein